MLSITTLYAIPLVMIFFVLWVQVSSLRVKSGVLLGHSENLELLVRVRRHGNFMEWVPFVLILMVLAEAKGADAIYIHIAGILLVAGRLIHPFGLRGDKSTAGRIIGNSANLLATLNLLICLIVKSAGW